ncbi:hypothetical protein KGP36_04215 [Patescibacteria group bacterium]|nr:hypothetical protein [Patescibacteria group bacterium]
MIGRLATKIAVWAYSGTSTENESGQAQDWADEIRRFHEVCLQWQNEFLALAKIYKDVSGQNINLGLLYTGMLDEPGTYGSGVPMFWTTQDDNSLFVVPGSEFSYGDINNLRKGIVDMLAVRPADYLKRIRIDLKQQAA